MKSFVVRLLVSTVAVTAVLLLVMLALASANTEFFDRYYGWLYAANVAVALVFMLIVISLIVIIITRVRQGRFGTRLLAKLALIFALVGVVPGAIIYIVSYQFVSRSIESWFDVNVETALTSGLTLGRGMLENSLTDLQNRSRQMADQLASADGSSITLSLLRLRDQYNVQDAVVFERPRDQYNREDLASNSGSLRTSSGLRTVAQASGNYYALLPTNEPTNTMLKEAQDHPYGAIEGELDGDPKDNGPKGALRLRVVTKIPDPTTTTAFQHVDRFLQIEQPVSQALAHNADAVQRAYREYQEKRLGRTGLRKMYIGTLTLALFLATFIAMMLALALGNQLARPLFLLAQGTKEVAEGDYTPKREINSRDELGFLTQSFNAMTRQLSEARAAVENNRIALEHSKAYLESILANLTAGVFVFDRQFRLTTANRGAERIFRQPFKAMLNQPIDHIGALAEFGAMVKKAFVERDAASIGADHPIGDRGHWQQQVAVTVPGENEPLTLLVRGTQLLSATDGEEDTETTGYVVVFDDISDVISAQRSVAWGEVARRLAHEIKNPLTPIQLSAERLQMKLADKLAPTDADVLKRASTTIVNQVQAMKQMVDDFREYARTPPAVLGNLQLNDLVAEVLTLYGIEDGKTPIKVDLAKLPVIRGDATQMRQVIHNLLQNAQDAVAEVKEPRVLLETRTVEYGDPDASGRARVAVRLTVSDNGAGFPARILSRAFEPYVTTKAKGTGLGLATVKKIVDEHGARIDIRNRSRSPDVVEGAQISILFLQLADDAATPAASGTGANHGTTKATVQTRAA
jgi:nitrogen fixation/metabolism regulation signal transduction histidine kinase